MDKTPLWLSIVTVAFLCGCSTEKKLPPTSVIQDIIARSYEVNTQLSEEGTLRICLEAPLQEEFKNGNQRFPKGIFIVHYNKNGQIKAKLTADSGFLFQEKGIYEARGHVLLKNIESESNLQTEKLTWDPKSQRIYTDTHVRIQNKDEIHIGEGLNASEDFKDYHILKPSGTMDVEKTATE